MGEDKEGRETRTHTQKSEKGNDKGITRGEEITWGRAFLTCSAPPPCSSHSLLALCKGTRAEQQSFGLNAHIQEDFPVCPGFALLFGRL